MAEATDVMGGEPQVEAEGLASATAEQQREFGWAADIASAAMPEFGSMTAHGRHYPTMSQRKPGSTVALRPTGEDSGRSTSAAASIPASVRRSCSRWRVPTRAASAASPIASGHWPKGSQTAEFASLEGLDTESFDARTWAAIAWAQAYARGDFGEVPDAIDAKFRQHFSPQEQADIELVVRTMYWMNETSNGVRAGLKRAKHSPVPGSTVPRELQAALLYAVGAPVVLGLLCVKQRRNPISMLREIGRSSRVRATRSKHDLRARRGVRRLRRKTQRTRNNRPRRVRGSPLRLAQGLLEIAENPKSRDRDRVAAYRELLDRGWGKAPAFAAVEADDPLELDVIAREVQAIADELRARRDAGV